jgi:protein-S-isoprenylcysteine O-methyltransferase Ste14
MTRLLILLFGVVSYAVFFLTFLYLIAFTGNLQQQPALVEWLPWLPELVPHSIDAGRESGALAPALAINLGLILLFGLQHSIMARAGFKRRLKRLVPASAERSVYVLISSACLILLYWQWRPIPEAVWSAQTAPGQAIGWAVFGLGFGGVLLSTFLINHFDLFGLRQVWNQLLNRPTRPLPFMTPLLYRIVRHPLYMGFLMAFWGGPTMTVGGLLFAGGMTVYILIGVRLEERDLEHFHGQDYVRYREQVPMLVPVPGRGRGYSTERA